MSNREISIPNRDNAMRMLRTKLYEMEKQKQDSEISNARKSQVGSGDRSEKLELIITHKVELQTIELV